ncbi:MAG: fimbrillin family protein [Bacteroidaceae bacterium]|nr:fimbrillin family protein [Bacteroidaceae bacterium]
MKKQAILAIMTAAIFAGCTNDETMTFHQEAITFDNAFVDNSTRAAYDDSYNNSTTGTNSLKEFQVWGTISNNGGTANIFKAEKVKRGNSLGCGTNWSYAASNTQYWVEGNTYNFWAIAEGNTSEAKDNDIVKITEVKATQYGEPNYIYLYDASKQKDILFAAAKNINVFPEDKTVDFTFQHLLAKAKFTVKNTISTNNGYSYQVSNITITNADKTAVYDAAGWQIDNNAYNDAPASTYALSFGKVVTTGNSANNAEVADIKYNASAESNYERLLIPNTKQWGISISYQLLKDGVVIDTQTKTFETGSAIALEKGKAYNFIINLGNPGDPITFDVLNVTDWNTTHNNYNVDTQQPENIHIDKDGPINGSNNNPNYIGGLDDNNDNDDNNMNIQNNTNLLDEIIKNNP